MEKIYKIKEAAKLLGYSVKTLQRLDREGILKANRTVTNRRYYTEKQLLKFLKKDNDNDNE
jgi:DNA-binding transcriptional MerR regulator